MVEARTHVSVVHFKTGRQGSFLISLRISLLSYLGGGGGDDTMIWQLNRSGAFDVHSFYTSLLAAPLVSFPWKSIWYVKVPKMMTFFLWTDVRVGLLTIDNHVKEKLPLVN